MASGAGLWLCGVALGGLLAAGCGSDVQKPPASCLQAHPCGGDIVGTWSFLGACDDLTALNSQLQQGCPGESVSAIGVELTGQLTFNADLTYVASNWQEGFAVVQNLPLSCAGYSTCAAGSGNMTQTSEGGTTRTLTSCSGTTVCDCRLTGSLTVTRSVGSYYIAGTTVDMVGGLTSSAFDYCVDGDQLHLLQVSSVGVPVSDIVAQRQASP
jgi:hypothetical protein